MIRPFCCGLDHSSANSVDATAAARALIDLPDLTAEEVAAKAMNVAADMCIYTNTNFLVETLDSKEPST